MASLMQKISALIQGSLHELVDKAMREKSLAVIDVYIRDAGEGLTELNDAIGTLEANLTGFQREREKLTARAAELDTAINRFLVKGDNSKAQAASAELMHIKELVAMQDQTIAQAQKDLVEQRRGKDILQSKITTMRYEREKTGGPAGDGQGQGSQPARPREGLQMCSATATSTWTTWPNRSTPGWIRLMPA